MSGYGSVLNVRHCAHTVGGPSDPQSWNMYSVFGNRSSTFWENDPLAPARPVQRL